MGGRALVGGAPARGAVRVWLPLQPAWREAGGPLHPPPRYKTPRPSWVGWRSRALIARPAHPYTPASHPTCPNIFRLSSAHAFLMAALSEADKYFLRIEPGVDAAFIVALAALTDEMFNDQQSG